MPKGASHQVLCIHHREKSDRETTGETSQVGHEQRWLWGHQRPWPRAVSSWQPKFKKIIGEYSRHRGSNLQCRRPVSLFVLYGAGTWPNLVLYQSMRKTTQQLVPSGWFLPACTVRNFTEAVFPLLSGSLPHWHQILSRSSFALRINSDDTWQSSAQVRVFVHSIDHECGHFGLFLNLNQDLIDQDKEHLVGRHVWWEKYLRERTRDIRYTFLDRKNHSFSSPGELFYKSLHWTLWFHQFRSNQIQYMWKAKLYF